MKKKYKITIDCADCARKIEAAAAKADGIKSLVVSFMTQKMMVEFAEGADAAAAMKEVAAIARKIEPDCEIFFG